MKSQQSSVLELIGTITSCEATVFAFPPPSYQFGPNFEVRGQLNVELKGVREFAITFRSADLEQISQKACVGHISATKPSLTGSVDIASGDFNVLLAFGSSGRLAQLHLSIDPPKRGRACVYSASVSTEPLT